MEQLTALVRVLQNGIASGDRERFARGLSYPMLIKTRSLCYAKISRPDEFLVHFDSVVNEATKKAIVDFKPPAEIDYRGFFLGNILLRWDGETFKVASIRANVWRLPSSACFGELDRPPPQWLNGKWRIASVVGLSSLPKVDASVEISLVDRRARLTIQGKTEQCKVERFAARSAGSDDEFSASHWGLTAGAKDEEVLDLVCGSEPKIYRLEVLKLGVLGLFRGQYTIVLRRAPPGVVPVHSRARGQTCGTPSLVCDEALTCEATVDTLDTPRCNLIDPEL